MQPAPWQLSKQKRTARVSNKITGDNFITWPW